MKRFGLASFDLATFDPAPRSVRRRSVAARPAPPLEPEAAPTPAVDPEVAKLGEVVASLSLQLGEVQAANAALVRKLDDHIQAPRREAEARWRLQHLFASRFQGPVS